MKKSNGPKIMLFLWVFLMVITGEKNGKENG